MYSPGLDEYGNSVRGISVCTEISNRLGLHVFATEDDDAMMRRVRAGTGSTRATAGQGALRWWVRRHETGGAVDPRRCRSVRHAVEG